MTNIVTNIASNGVQAKRYSFGVSLPVYDSMVNAGVAEEVAAFLANDWVSPDYTIIVHHDSLRLGTPNSLVSVVLGCPHQICVKLWLANIHAVMYERGLICSCANPVE